MAEESDTARLEFERWRAEQDIALRERELKLREHEAAEARQRKTVAAQVFSPVGVAVIAALLGLLGTAASGLINANTEKFKQQSALILKTSDIEDEKVRARNLLFFAQMGFLDLPLNYQESLRKTAGLTKEQLVPPPVTPQKHTYGEWNGPVFQGDKSVAPRVDAERLWAVHAALRRSNVRHKLGALVGVNKTPEEIDALGVGSFVRYLVAQATEPDLLVPASVDELSMWCRDTALKQVDYSRVGSAQPDEVFIAVVPNKPGQLGYAWLVHDGKTLELRARDGVSSRSWSELSTFAPECYVLPAQ